MICTFQSQVAMLSRTYWIEFLFPSAFVPLCDWYSFGLLLHYTVLGSVA
uniref:Uncharacterized protein n=1 Tax=Anguilla anguilla TaxID=7936 RepID=A0A0E9U9Y0_ANGAN